MRKHLILILSLYSCSSYAQNYVDILRAEYTATPQNTFDSSNQTTDLQKVNLNLTVPLELKNGNAILAGVVYDRVSTAWDPNENKMPVSSYILKVGMNVKHSEKWSASYLLLPKVASNFKEELRKEDFQVGGLILAKMKKNENFSYKFGTYMNGDRFGPFLVPLFGFYYQKDKL